MIEKREIDYGESAAHTEILNRILNKPTLIAPDFVPIKKEVVVLRGRVDLIGKLGNEFCLVEIKVDTNSNGKIAVAKRQLVRYARALNTYFYTHNLPEVNYKFVIVRKTKVWLQIAIYDSMEEMQKEERVLGKPFFNK